MQTIYEKRGRRYHAIAYYDPKWYESLPLGHHLISVLPGEQSTHRNVEPDYAPILAAVREHRDAIILVLQKEGAATSQRPLSNKEREGLAAYTKITGNEALWLNRPSAMAMVYALEDAILRTLKAK